MTLVGSLPFSSKNREVFASMIEQTIEEWKAAYNDAEPEDKGFMIGQLIGEAISVAVGAGCATNKFAKFVKSGNFKKAVGRVIKKAKYNLSKLKNMNPSKIIDSIKKITRKKNHYEVVMNNDDLVTISFDELTNVQKSKFDGLADSYKGKDIIHDRVNGEEGLGVVDDIENTGNFIYKNNPLDNPKATKDILKNDKAVYGFTPDPNSDSIGGFSDLIDWTDPEQVAGKRAERIKYHQKNDNIFNRIKEMKNQGATTEEIATEAVNMRNQNRLDSYVDNPQGLSAAMEHNINVYGNTNGATPEFLFKKYGSWDTVLQKTISANPGMDACLGLYDDYYYLYSIN
ncbi:hypothetical protein SH1V18_10810 [Vallitalea longa]|uniref:Uncharacterized protein n=1 Tax=Vallitalea longa TaxID=2936439 RepID=A0A9W5Y9W7_9FIRM|nr:hypothetical protein [Vallitalea longa]GKX28601.1 hypothetical protein SH1V18_10810 [Vallitalea longa]